MSRKKVSLTVYVSIILTLIILTESALCKGNDYYLAADFGDANNEQQSTHHVERASNPREDSSTVKIPYSDVLEIEGGEIGDIRGENALLFIENEARGYWEFAAPVAGKYRVKLNYKSMSSRIGDFEISILINNEIQYPSLDGIKLQRRYVDEIPITQDSRGNDIRPVRKEETVWIRADIKCSKGIYNDPLTIELQEGVNTLEVETTRGEFALKDVVLYIPDKIETYNEYLKTHKNKDLELENIFEKVQAEKTYAVSNTLLHPTYDKSNAATEPNDPARLKLNTIGQDNWRMPGQWIEWEIFAPKSGFYNIGMRVRQNYLRGYFSTRAFYLNGDPLFEEVKHIKFPYNIGWYIKSLGDDDKDYSIYLEEGSNILRMQVAPGVAGEVITKFDPIILGLNTLYRRMIMITGINPDRYRDYKLQDDIPELITEFEEYATLLRELREEIAMLGIRTGSDAVVVEKLYMQLESFIRRPDSIPMRLQEYRDNISAVSAWMLNLKEQPLEIDYIYIKSPDMEHPEAGASFFQQLVFRIMSLISSYFFDYTSIGDTIESDLSPLEVWTMLGRDQAQIIKDLSDNYFVPEHNVPVNISIVQQGLTEAIAAGKGPDIALFTQVGDSVNFAARGALEDFSQYENIDEISSRYLPASLEPFVFMDKLYGIPLQNNFNMMYYRKDIFDELNIEPPSTWKEFYDVMLILQKNKLLVGIPVGTPILPDNSVFDMLLFQNGGEYYNADRSSTMFHTEQALNAFVQWTDFYRKYSLPIAYDFYNRFRSGEMPLGIASYIIYNMFSLAAPEIEGLWEMVPVPGTVREDGSIDRTTTGGLTGLIMLKGISDIDIGFKYVDWFSSNEIQLEYGLAVENIFGQTARYDAANVEALINMNWTEAEAGKLMEQFEMARFAPQIPASYYITRHITNAFRSVVLTGENPREALYSYNVEMNDEIERKRIELGID